MKTCTASCFRRNLLSLLALLFLSNVSFSAIIYVDPSAGGGNNGTSWSDAYTDLQLALASATAGDEIWVVEGVYKPSVAVDVDGSGGLDAREVTFQIPDGVALYGGFAGGEVLLTGRDFVGNPTILSGDIDNNDVDLDGNSIAETTADIVGNNAYHVIYTQSVSAATIVDGFIITAGEAGDFMPLGFSPNRSGGGWYNDDNPPADISSPTIAKCHFSGNYADASGGGFYIGSFTAGTYEPSISNCEFTGNEALRAGGGIYLLGDASTVSNCVFLENRATNISIPDTGPGAGGAAFLSSSNAVFTSCRFENNSATGNPTGAFEGGGGGAVYISQGVSAADNLGPSFPRFIGCSYVGNNASGNGSAWGGAATHYSDGGNLRVSYVNCVFHINTASDDGGAVANFVRVISAPAVLDPILEPEFTNCTFYNNVADVGGALYLNGFTYMGTQILTARIENCILHTNAAITSDPQVFNSGNTTVINSLIQGSGGSGGGWDASIGTDGGNNIDTNPDFISVADTDGPDGILGNADDGLALNGTSPAVNTGNNAAPGLVGITEDITGAARIQAATVDMGAYESPFAMNPCGSIPTGLTSADIGNTGGYAGTVCYNMGTYEVDASGKDIWGIKDGFHFVYRTIHGDGEIVARVDDIGFNNFWDLAGVMMRANLSPKSKNVLMAVNAGGKAFMQRRRWTGWFTGIRFGGNGSTPRWVKLVRYGNFFAGYKSSNGSSWQWIGTFYVPMPHTIYVGIATSTPLAGTPNQYEISNLSIEGVSYKQAPFDTENLTEVRDLDGPRTEQLVVLEPTFQVYPNPAEEHAVLELIPEEADQVRVAVFDVQGRLISRVFAGEVLENERYEFELPVHQVASGLYFIRLEGEKHQEVLQWIKK